MTTDLGRPLDSPRNVVSTAAGITLLLTASAAALARYTPIPNHLALYAVIASPYLLPTAPFAFVVLLWGRRWLLATLSACLCAALVITQLPYYIATAPNPASIRVGVMTLNMRFGRADPRQIVSIAGRHADILMLQELTVEAVEALSAAGIDKTFPYHALEPRAGPAGIGVYSHYPTTAADTIGGLGKLLLSMRIRVSSAAEDVTVVSTHMGAPWPQPIDSWHDNLASFQGALAKLSAEAGGGVVIVGGDFNSTIDMRPFRRAVGNGFRDAAEQAGVGRAPTYPSNRRFPALIGIDHVLTRNSTATSLRSVDVARTDHRALIAEVEVPAG
ncbi:endonuclease/exonuclease/phosphatase family protein [Mycolicibacterium tusciae]|uniref:endonuclease/exonuclease/phosphatase family protein n=1 Tax=Mycolicibacterium tusciae TaxID=75922 RepID=UPI00024A5071|nr:endonuclease/exonuclease/phosphatase family protein [Mycolicibacterium tusciae]